MKENFTTLKPKTSKHRTDNACVVSTETARVVSLTRTLLALMLALLFLLPQWGFAQDDRFSGRTVSYITPDITSTSWTTSWQTRSGTMNAGYYHRYDCYLTSGVTYEFNTCSELGGGGDANFDTYMALRNGYGDYASGLTWLAYNDDGCSSQHSTITYTATSTGWTSLYIAAYSNTASGTYTLAYRQKPTFYTISTAVSPSGAGSVIGGHRIITRDAIPVIRK